MTTEVDLSEIQRTIHADLERFRNAAANEMAELQDELRELRRLCQWNERDMFDLGRIAASRSVVRPAFIAPSGNGTLSSPWRVTSSTAADYSDTTPRRPPLRTSRSNVSTIYTAERSGCRTRYSFSTLPPTSVTAPVPRSSTPNHGTSRYAT